MDLFSRAGIATILIAFTAQVSGFTGSEAFAQAPIALPPAVHPGMVAPHKPVKANAVRARTTKHQFAGSVKLKSKHGKSKHKQKPAPPPPPPQNYLRSLSSETIAPGVVHRVHRGAMYINVLDVDLAKANVVVKPVLAGESFNTLDEVRDQAAKVHAIAAVNGNYFKHDGTPLGTLIIDGEWVAGPLLDRTCMGITKDGQVLVDRVQLHGTLATANPEHPTIWVNNINQPRRHGAHCIAYTSRWGKSVDMKYDGTLLAVDADGKIIDKALSHMKVPPGGYVLSDSKESAIADLNVGDNVALSWQVSPPEWKDVVNAVSGGPDLINDGKLNVDCKDESFGNAWASNHIHARTAVGVTNNRHLLLATIEGPHTLWDVSKFLRGLGAVDAMNLDGGGSTTMIIGSHPVTHNSSHFQRQVASALAILPRPQSETAYSDLSRYGVYTYGKSVKSFQAVYGVVPEKPVAAQSPTTATVTSAVPITATAAPVPLPNAPTATPSTQAQSKPLATVAHDAASPLNTNSPAVNPIAAQQEKAALPVATEGGGTAAPADSAAGHFGWLKHHHSADAQ